VNIEFQLILMYTVLEGFNVTFASTPQPNIYDLTPGYRSPILLFAIDSLIFMLFVAIQVKLKIIAAN
jgi:hypothetical protein